MEEDTKPWWQSRTIWGSIVTTISLLAYLLGFGDMLDGGKITQIVDVLLLLFGSGGIFTSVVGRFMASQKLG
jgi:uncharacterized membrane protein